MRSADASANGNGGRDDDCSRIRSILGFSSARRVAGGRGEVSGSDLPGAHRGAAAADNAAIAVADLHRNRGRATMTTTTPRPTRRVGHRDQSRHVDLSQPKAMAGAAPKITATVMAAVVTTATLVANVHS